MISGGVRKDSGFFMEDPSGIIALLVEPQSQLYFEEPGSSQPCERIQAVLDQRIFNIGKALGGDCSNRICWIVGRSLKGHDIIGLQMGGYNQPHLPTPGSQAGNAACR